VGEIYSYEVQVQRLDGTLSDKSDPTQFIATSPVSSGFDCVGNKGHIHWHDYNKLDREKWTITPPDDAGLLINVCCHSSTVP
jgi:hypothetical protein